MFKKPKRNFRSRRKDSEPPGDEETDTNNGTVCNNNVAHSIPSRPTEKTMAKPAKKENVNKTEKSVKLPKVPSATSMLSFEHEDGDSEMFQIKKPKHSRHIAKQLKKASQREKEQNNERKPVKAGGTGTIEMQIGSDAESDLDDQEENTRLPSLRNILEGGQIPDAAMIHMIRKKRQQKAREMTDEFIPIDQKAKEGSSSRLIREEDHDHSDEEDGDRLNFAVNSRETELRHIQDTILAAEEGSHSEGSDHESEWEKQQILKGVKVGVGSAPPTQPTVPVGGDYYGSYQGSSAAAPGMFGFHPHVPMSYASTQQGGIGVKTLLTDPGSQVTVEQIKKALKDRLDDMTSVHRAHVQERDDMESRFEASGASIIELDGAKAGLEERYQFYQEIRGYVRDLVECFNEKVPVIERVEKGLFNMLKQSSEKLVKRRQDDIKDQCDDHKSTKSAPTPNLAAMNIAGEDQAKQRRAAEREARRARRRRGRQTSDARSAKEHNDGMSTDDEVNNSDVARYKVERERLMREADTVFDNVVDDFHDIRLVMSKFERWKRVQNASYEEAYIGLCLPRLFTPLVRLKLVDWNPLENPFTDVESMSWYSALVMYGCRDTGGALLVDDSSMKLIPSIIEKVLLPKLADFAENVWDPMSGRQTKNLAAAVRKLIDDYPTVSSDSKGTQALVKAIVLRMRKTLEDDVFMPLYPKQVVENRLGGPAIFFHRQFWTSIKLLGNMLQWTGVVSSKTQQELGLDGLLNRYLILALHNSHVSTDGIARCETIAATFPREWFAELKSERTIDKLEVFCRYLVHTAGEVSRTPVNARDPERREMRECLKRVARLLVKIHAVDHATTLASLHGLNISLSLH